MKINRNRLVYTIAVIVVMIMGLMSRKIEGLPRFLEVYSGDTLWAMMVFLGIAFLFNKQSTKYIALMALLFSFGIEFSQLYHEPWIDSIRSTTLGGLVLGYGFLWSDLICYTVGIVIAIIFDYYINQLKGYYLKKDSRIHK